MMNSIVCLLSVNGDRRPSTGIDFDRPPHPVSREDPWRHLVPEPGPSPLRTMRVVAFEEQRSIFVLCNVSSGFRRLSVFGHPGTRDLVFESCGLVPSFRDHLYPDSF